MIALFLFTLPIAHIPRGFLGWAVIVLGKKISDIYHYNNEIIHIKQYEAKN